MRPLIRDTLSANALTRCLRFKAFLFVVQLRLLKLSFILCRITASV